MHTRSARRSGSPKEVADRHRQTGGLPECEPDEKWVVDNCVPNDTVVETDKNALLAVAGSWISHYAPAAEACPRAYQTIANHQRVHHMNRCTLQEFDCQFISSMTHNLEYKRTSRHVDALKLLAHMDALGLRGAVVWALRVEDSAVPPHELMHHSIHASLAYAFSLSSTPRHLCWARGDALPRNCSLNRLLGYEGPGTSASQPGSVMGQSLVFVSPKHLVWSRDKALINLPVDLASAYVFHELVPPRFSRLVPFGRVVQWITSGPGDSSPYFDSASFVARSSPLVRECQSWPPCAREGTVSRPATFVSALASSLSPADIERESAAMHLNVAARAHKRAVNIDGSIWKKDRSNVCTFIAGCHAAGVSVLVGVHEATPARMQCAHDGQHMFDVDTRRVTTPSERSMLLSLSSFAPVFEGDRHLSIDIPELSFIPVSAFDAAALGQIIATDNTAVARMLRPMSKGQLIFSPNVSELCTVAATRLEELNIDELQKLQHFIWARHTYVSRLRALVELFPARKITPHVNTHATWHKEDVLSTRASRDARWCSNYDVVLGARSHHQQRLFVSILRLMNQVANDSHARLLSQDDKDACSKHARPSYCLWGLRQRRCLQRVQEDTMDELVGDDKRRCIMLCKAHRLKCAARG